MIHLHTGLNLSRPKVFKYIPLNESIYLRQFRWHNLGIDYGFIKTDLK